MLEVKWKAIGGVTSDGLDAGFNPCYVGSKMESERIRPLKPEDFEFQSLLCWK